MWKRSKEIERIAIYCRCSKCERSFHRSDLCVVCDRYCLTSTIPSYFCSDLDIEKKEDWKYCICCKQSICKGHTLCSYCEEK